MDKYIFTGTRPGSYFKEDYCCGLDGSCDQILANASRRLSLYYSKPFDNNDTLFSFLKKEPFPCLQGCSDTKTAMFISSKTSPVSPYIEIIEIMLVDVSFTGLTKTQPHIKPVLEATICLDFSGKKAVYTISENGDKPQKCRLTSLYPLLNHMNLLPKALGDSMTRCLPTPLASIKALNKMIGLSEFVVAGRADFVFKILNNGLKFPKEAFAAHGNIYELMGVKKELGEDLCSKYPDSTSLFYVLCLASIYPDNIESVIEDLSTLSSDKTLYLSHDFFVCVKTLFLIAKHHRPMDIKKFMSYISAIKMQAGYDDSISNKLNYYHDYIRGLLALSEMTENPIGKVNLCPRRIIKSVYMIKHISFSFSIHRLKTKIAPCLKNPESVGETVLPVSYKELAWLIILSNKSLALPVEGAGKIVDKDGKTTAFAYNFYANGVLATAVRKIPKTRQ